MNKGEKEKKGSELHTHHLHGSKRTCVHSHVQRGQLHHMRCHLIMLNPFMIGNKTNPKWTKTGLASWTKFKIPSTCNSWGREMTWLTAGTDLKIRFEWQKHSQHFVVVPVESPENSFLAKHSNGYGTWKRSNRKNKYRQKGQIITWTEGLNANKTFEMENLAFL